MSAHGLCLQPSRLKVSLALPSKPTTPTPGSLAATGTPDSNRKGTIDSSLSLTMAVHGRPPGPTRNCWVTCPAGTGFLLSLWSSAFFPEMETSTRPSHASAFPGPRCTPGGRDGGREASIEVQVRI